MPRKPTPHIICPIISDQLTIRPGQRSRVVERHLAVLAEIKNGSRSPLLIAYALGLTVSQINSSVKWLVNAGYLRPDLYGQIAGLTPAGKKALRMESLSHLEEAA